MSQYIFNINGYQYTVNVDPTMPLLWILRDCIGLTGTKYGCGIGQCGACTVHLDGEPKRSCLISAADSLEKEITTIEGISENNQHPVQKAWLDAQVPQCGYCHSGQIMTAVALLEANPKPSNEEIETAMNGVLCRCGTYPRIKKALYRLTKETDS